MKKLIFLFLVLSLMLFSVLSVSAATPSAGDIHPSALSYFTGVVDKLEPNTDYVVYCINEYSAAIVYSSDLTFENSVFKCTTPCDSFTYDLHGIDKGDGVFIPSIILNPLTEFELSVSDNYIIYSSLGDYAAVGNTNKDVFSYILWSVILLILLFVVFKFFRNRRHYINI